VLSCQCSATSPMTCRGIPDVKRSSFLRKAASPTAKTYARAKVESGKTPWREAHFCVVDLELSGLDPRSDEIISYGAVPIDFGRVVAGNSLYGLCRPTSDCLSSRYSSTGFAWKTWPKRRRSMKQCSRSLPLCLEECWWRTWRGSNVHSLDRPLPVREFASVSPSSTRTNSDGYLHVSETNHPRRESSTSSLRALRCPFTNNITRWATHSRRLRCLLRSPLTWIIPRARRSSPWLAPSSEPEPTSVDVWAASIGAIASTPVSVVLQLHRLARVRNRTGLNCHVYQGHCSPWPSPVSVRRNERDTNLRSIVNR